MSNVGANWTYAAPVRTSGRRGVGDRYLQALGVVLLGYALLGRSFAYLGVPPLFISEILLLGGLALVGMTRWPGRVFEAPAMRAVVLFMAWVAVRTVPYIPEYGIDAIRDGMVAGYGLFSFVVVLLLVQRPERLPEMLTRYRILVVVTCSVAWAIYLVSRMNEARIPTLPWADNVRVIENKPGDLAVHMAGISAFVLLGWRRATPWLLTLLVVGSAAMMVGNRGGMVGYMLAMGVFAVMRPERARFGRLLYVGALLVVLGLAVDTSGIQTNEGSRSLSVEQLWKNVQSVFVKSDDFALSTTTEWRKVWWGKIVGYTVLGEYRWTGKGFGRNIATEDGFQVDEEGSLRSPHNVQMTLLARSGLPGVALWLALHLLWWLAVLRAWTFAKRNGLTEWVAFFAFCAVYWVAALVNGTFDVYLEGPMGAIWFWTVFGTALAGTRLVREHPHLLDGLPDTAGLATPEHAWSWGSADAPAWPTARPASAPPSWQPIT